MKKFALAVSVGLWLGASVLSAQANGLGDVLREEAQQPLGGGAASTQGGAASGLGGLMGGSGGTGAGSALGGLGGLGALGLSTPGTAGNAAGVITYCMKNNYLNPDKAAQVKDQLLGKIGLGPKEAPKDEGYESGLGGLIKGSGGQTFSLDKIKGNLKEKACDFVLNHAKSLL